MVYKSAQYEKAQATGKIGTYDYIKNSCSMESLTTFSRLLVLGGHHVTSSSWKEVSSNDKVPLP